MLIYLLVHAILAKIADARLKHLNKDVHDSCIKSLRESHEYWKEYRENKMKKIKEFS